MIGTGRPVTPYPRKDRIAGILLAVALAILHGATCIAASQPGPGTPSITGKLTAPELPTMMLTPADLDGEGLAGAAIGGGQTFTRLADAVSSESFGLSRGLLHLSAVSTSESVLADAGWQRFHERRIGTPTADSPPRFAVEAVSGVESFITAQGATDAFAFYADPQVALRMSPVENLPVDDPPAIGDESALWQIRGETADSGQQYRGLSLWFRTGNLIASVAVIDYESGKLPSQQLVEALAERLLARIDDVRQHGGPGLGDSILRLGGEAVAISTDQYRIMDGEVLPLLSETADARASRTQIRDQFDMTDDYYVFADIAAGGPGTADDRTFSLSLTRFADASGASDYLAGFPDRLRDSSVEDIVFPSDAPTLGDESNAATWTVTGGDGGVRHYVDLVVRVDREIFRLRISGSELIDWSVAETLATEQIACLQDGGCLEALEAPDELLA